MIFRFFTPRQRSQDFEIASRNIELGRIFVERLELRKLFESGFLDLLGHSRGLNSLTESADGLLFSVLFHTQLALDRLELLLQKEFAAAR